MADIYLRSTGSYLPPAVAVQTLIDQGLTTTADQVRTRMQSVTVTDRHTAAEMAVQAGRLAIERAGADTGALVLSVHADVYHQGRDTWAVASYIQNGTVGATHAPAIEVRQMSNGGLAGLCLAYRWLATADPDGQALLTAADRFCPPGFDRFGTDLGTVYADGAAAAVLSRAGGFARVRAAVLRSDPALEPMHRHGVAPSAADREHGGVIDFESAKKRFLAEVGVGYAVQRAAAGQHAVLQEALGAAAADLADIDWFVLPHFGYQRLSSIYFTPFGIDPGRTTWEWGRTVGHLGAADQLAGLDYLAQRGALREGQLVLLLGVGAGYSWGAVVLEVTQDWHGQGSTITPRRVPQPAPGRG